MYSHLNPLQFLVIFKPVQHKFLGFVNVALCSHENGFGLAREKPETKLAGQVNNGNASNVQHSKRQRKTKVRKRVRICVLVLKSAVFVLILITILICSKHRTSSSELKEKISHLKSIPKLTNSFLSKRLSPHNSLPKKLYEDPRVDCGEKHGVFLLRFGRCYFMKTHDGAEKLNLTEQIGLCENQNATLYYPMTPFEARTVFRYHLLTCGTSCRQNFTIDHGWFLRLGAKQFETSKGSPLFVSVDVYRVFYPTDYWDKGFEYPEYRASFFDHSGFRRTAWCITFRGFPFSCLASLKTTRTICFFDFSAIPKNSHIA